MGESQLFIAEPSKCYEKNLQSVFQTGRSEIDFFQNRKMTSIRIVFRLNKTFFTLFGNESQ